ncbi:MAG: accC1 [Firmicutes bacterium]|nr:accC1 [Bacillota bacterium]
MIKKILIANRGEIVSRIIKTCKLMGIETVVVYSEADKNASYIKQATESYCIGAPSPIKSYLNIDAILDVLQKSKADAVHPGYGFLSEKADFAKAVSLAGAKWIGPDPAVLENIESKCYCRKLADDLNLPVTPGTIQPVKSIHEIYELAKNIGVPLMMKLDKGGGGKGIQRIDEIHDPEKMQVMLESLRRVGLMAFASGDVYVEKVIDQARHIEVQFLADEDHHVVCLGERECSIQRRYQKIIEESPSVVVSETERQALFSYTKKLIETMQYTGAGTIEYLRDMDGAYYFMEINARLQVEHPVTEYITNIDIVEQQIRIAAGEKLAMQQQDIRFSGHAIECRIYAEDPDTFMPSPGIISKLSLPDTKVNDRLRIDSAAEEGGSIPPYYDPLFAKVISWGTDRLAAIEILKEGLMSVVVEGIKTTIRADLEILNHPKFVTGDINTAFLSEERCLKPR